MYITCIIMFNLFTQNSIYLLSVNTCIIFVEQLESRLKTTKEELERQLKYLPAFKILPKDNEAYLKVERKLKALSKQKWLLERLILEKS